MPRYLLGQGVNLAHEVHDRAGQLADATVAFTATPAVGTPVVPVVTKVATGKYQAATFVPVDPGPWTYKVLISGAVSDVAFGAFTVVDGSTLTVPPAGAYASQVDLADIVYPLPDDADRLLQRAAREIDRALLCASYDTDDAAVIEALRQASLEQIAGNRQDGDTSGLGGVVTTVTDFSLGKLSVKRQATASTPVPRTGGLVDQAYAILQAAGLTGGAPGERWPVW